MAGRSALVVCNNSQLVRWLVTVIRGCGYVNVDVAQNGQDVPRILSRKSYSLLLLDDDRNNINPVRIIKQIQKAMAPSDIKVVVMVDGCSREVVDSIKHQGLSVSGLLVKPFEAANLQKILLRFVKAGDACFESSEVDYTEIVLSSREMLVKVVDCDVFVGVSFKGNITYSDAALIKKSFYKAYSIDKSVIIAINLSESRGFDEGFIGLLLQYNGMVEARGRSLVAITGHSNISQRFGRLGLHNIIKTYSSSSEFYCEVGFFAA